MTVYQPSLPLLEPDALELRFAEFHRENPHVYRAFERFACEALRSGHRVGAKAIWERMRWHLFMETSEGRDGGYRLNNNLTAYYARELMRRRPEFAGFFEIRRVRGEVTVQ
jgi:hypothetical protein